MDYSTPGFSVLHYLPEFAQTRVHWVDDAIEPSHPLSPLLFLPSVSPSIRVFSNKSALHIRRPKYWSFRFNISPSNDYSGLISFRTDWFDLLAVQRNSQESSPTPQFKRIHSLALGRTLLAFALLHFVFQGQTCYSRYLLTSSFCIPIPYDEEDIFFWC